MGYSLKIVDSWMYQREAQTNKSYGVSHFYLNQRLQWLGLTIYQSRSNYRR